MEIGVKFGEGYQCVEDCPKEEPKQRGARLRGKVCPCPGWIRLGSPPC